MPEEIRAGGHSKRPWRRCHLLALSARRRRDAARLTTARLKPAMRRKRYVDPKKSDQSERSSTVITVAATNRRSQRRTRLHLRCAETLTETTKEFNRNEMSHWGQLTTPGSRSAGTGIVCRQRGHRSD